MGNNISIVCLLITDNSMPSSVWGLSAPNSSLFACFTKMELDPVNIFPLPAGMILSFIGRGHQGATARGRDFSLPGLVCSSLPAPAACGCSGVWFPTRMTSPACSNQQLPQHCWGTSLWTTPPAPQRVDLQQMPWAQHLSQLTHHPGSHSLVLPIMRKGSF